MIGASKEHHVLPRELIESAHPTGTSASVTRADPIGVEEPTANPDRLDDIAKAHVLEVLAKHNGNKAQTARSLGIHRRKLYRLLERFSHDSAEGDQLVTADSDDEREDRGQDVPQSTMARDS